MPSSEEFHHLEARIKVLRKHFLPKNFDPTGSYSDMHFDRARAFRLLAHAELEWYLERVVIRTANQAYDNWVNSGSMTQPLIALLAYYGATPERIPDSKPAPAKGPPDLQIRVKRSMDLICQYAYRDNHGIRESQILRLLFPVGIKEVDIDTTWLSTIDSFGKNRGESAHRSNTVSNPPDPQNELATVNQILDGLKHIDEMLVAFQIGHS